MKLSKRGRLRSGGMKYWFIVLALFHSWTHAQWSRVPDIPENRIVHALLATQDTLYAATDSLFYVGAGGGTDWSSRSSPVPAPDAMSCLLKFRGVVLAGTFQSGIFKSTDEGSSWRPFSDGLSGLGSLDISSLLIRRDSLIAGTLGAGIFATAADFSHPWSGWGDSLSAYQGDNVFKMLVVGNTVLAGAGANGYMFRYTDAQPWWNPIPINIPRRVGQFVSQMASDGNTVVAGTNTGVYRSTNQGLSWEKTNLVLPPLTIQTLLLFHGPTLFALTTTPLSSSLFASHDLGKTWEGLGLFPLSNAFDAAVVGNTFFVGRAGGLWEAPLSQLVTTAGDDRAMPLDFNLHQNFPNPFNPTTTISFDLPSTSFVSLKVFDALGREVSILLHEDLPAGTFSRQWNATGLPSGVYFYRLSARAYTATKKLVLLR